MKDGQALLMFLSVFLTSFLGLVLQIVTTRIFSTTIWYHYAFVVISIALFGLALGGLAIHFLKPRIYGKELTLIAALLVILSISMPVYLYAILWIPAFPSSIVLYYLVSLGPFFLAGTCLALIYSKFTESASKLYFADLAGASLSCLAAEPILSAFGAESAILFLAVVASVSGLLISISSKRRRLIVISLIAIMTLSTMFVGNLQYSFMSISNAPTKLMYQVLNKDNSLKIALTRWNSFSRIDVIEGFQGNVLAVIFIDADASTSVYQWDGTDESLQYLRGSMEILPYNLVRNPRTLVIGPGGGKDILFALCGGSSEVVGVELNPLIVEAVRNYGAKTGNIYFNLSNVNVLVDEGRSFISRSNEKFDVVGLTFVDSWAAISAGGYALAENYLYTKEAFVDYLNHLTDKGLMMMVRYEGEIPRLVSTAIEAFNTIGENITDVGKHIAVVTHELEPGQITALFMLKRSPFSVMEAQNLKTQIEALDSSYTPYYIPFVNEIEPYRSLFNGSITLDQFYGSYPKRVDAVDDDSPYYFNFEHGVPSMLSSLIIAVSLLSFVLIIVPLALDYKKRNRIAESRIVSSDVALLFILFFSSLGIGFMLLETALIQKFILFLGYPTRALSVVLFSLLLSCAVGSFISGHFAHGYEKLIRNILIACPLIIGVAIFYAFSLPVLFSFFLPQSPLVRIMVTVFLVFPLGLFMGIPFPSSLRVLGMKSNQNVSWMWGVNGATSVLGSILATIIGITYGFNLAIALGALAYLISLLCVLGWKRRI